MGFEVETIDQKAIDELGVFSWPGLEKQAETFTKNAGADELLMVYVKEGSANIADLTTGTVTGGNFAEGTETGSVKAGQMVMISDGEVQWTDLSEGGLTLIFSTTELKNIEEDEEISRGGFSLFGGLGGGGGDSAPKVAAEEEEIKDITLEEAGFLLGAGLVAGGLFAFGLLLINGKLG